MSDLAASDRFTERILDALREVSNVGCGHAATAFARMLGGRVDVTAPESAAATEEEIARRLGTDPDAVTISFAIEGGAGAAMVLVFSAPSARALGAAMVPGSGPLAREALEAITEMGNILASSYLNAVGRMAQLTLVPSTPALLLGHQAELKVRLAGPEDVVLESSFVARGGAVDGSGLTGKILLVGTPVSLGAILKNIGVS